MPGKIFITRVLIGVIIFVMIPYGAFAQDAPPTEPVSTFSQQQLDQMLAPIALYPDSLLAQILIAATYPDQVMDADRWLKANPDLSGDSLNSGLDAMKWDLSVKALGPFPQVLAMMAQEPDWTQRMGEAFLGQQADVMDSIQRLRHKAQAAGNLQTSAEQKVVVDGENLEVEPANPEEVYVPRYDPSVAYGDWGYPDYPPYAYYPSCCWPAWPLVGIGIGIGFWGCVGVGPIWGWGWGWWGWGGRNVNINVNRNVNINNRNVNANNFRNSMRTANLNQAAAGRIGSGRAQSAARANAARGSTNGSGRTGSSGGSTGRAGMGAGSASGTGSGVGSRGSAGGATRTGISSSVARPSAASVMQGLRAGRSSSGTRGGSAYGCSRSGYSNSGRSAGSGGNRSGSYGGSSRSRSGYSNGGRYGSGGNRSGSYGGSGRSTGGFSRGGGGFGGSSRGGGFGGSSHGGGGGRGR